MCLVDRLGYYRSHVGVLLPGWFMYFKKCSGCDRHWASRDDFITDPEIKLIGYQINLGDLDRVFFMFNHLNPKCLTTLSLQTGLFKDLHFGEVYTVRQMGSEQCPGHCLYRDHLQACPVHCDCNFVREVMQVVLKWPKSAVV